MDEIIYLESDEEITSVIDKLKALDSQQKAVSLVIPKGAAILQSVVNLKLLQKEGVSLSKDLSIVTQDRIGRNLASQAGFSVYDDINASKPIIEPPRPQPKTEEIIELDLTGKQIEDDKAPKGINVHRYDNSYSAQKNDFKNKTIEPEIKSEPEPLSEQNQPVPLNHKNFNRTEESFHPVNLKSNTKDEHRSINDVLPSSKKSKKKKIVIAAIIGLTIIACAALFYFFYIKAFVNLVIKGDSLESSVEIIVDNNINQADVSRLAISGQLVESEQQGGKKFSATGKKDVGENAKGTITTYNESGESQKVSSGTEYKSDSGLIFKATGDATIPGATASVDGSGNVTKVSGKADVSVEASEPGDKYNIGPTNFSVSGKSMLSGKSTSPMSGGVSRQLTVVSQNDLNSAKAALTQDISNTLHEELKKKADKNRIIDSSIKDEVISTEVDKKVGDEADSFEMKVKIKSSAISFSEEDFRKMVVEAIQKTIPADKTLNLSPQDEISISGGVTDTSTGLLKLNGTVKTKTIPKIDDQKLKQDIAGKTKSQAESIIKENKNIQSVDISLRPSWWLKRIPTSQKNIVITKTTAN
jgi:hypothetical protein